MRYLLALLALVISGCSGDPATSRLQPGQMVIVPDTGRTDAPNTAQIEGPNGEMFPENHPARKLDSLTQGDEAIVVSDDGVDDPETLQRRWVVVRITKQKHFQSNADVVGVICRVPRRDIRPIP